MEKYQINPENIPKDLEADEKTKLWRYMSFSSLCEILWNDCIPLISIRNFPDKSEGAILREILSKLPNVNEKHIEYAMQKYRESVYISSWHISDIENAAMWERYTHGGEGIAIKTNAKLLLECIPHQEIISDSEGDLILPKPTELIEGTFQPQRAIIKPIEYIDNNPSDFNMHEEDFRKGYDKLCFFYKMAEFEDEQEVRILTSLFQDPYGYLTMTPEQFYEYSVIKPKSFNNSLLKCIGSANKLIQEIITSPHAHNNFIRTVEDIIRSINEYYAQSPQYERFDCEVVESRRKEWV